MDKIRLYIYFAIGCVTPVIGLALLCLTKQPAYIATSVGIMLFGFCYLVLACINIFKAKSAKKVSTENK